MSYHYGHILKLDSITTYAHGFMVLILSFAELSDSVYEIGRALSAAYTGYHDSNPMAPLLSH